MTKAGEARNAHRILMDYLLENEHLENQKGIIPSRWLLVKQAVKMRDRGNWLKIVSNDRLWY